MTNYEITLVIAPDMTEADAQKLEAKLHDSIAKKGGTIISHNSWGKHQLSYPISKHEFGYYASMIFALPADQIQELTNEIRLTAPIIRHLLISIDKEKVTLDDIRRGALIKEQLGQRTTDIPSTSRPRSTSRTGVTSRPTPPTAAPQPALSADFR